MELTLFKRAVPVSCAEGNCFGATRVEVDMTYLYAADVRAGYELV